LGFGFFVGDIVSGIGLGIFAQGFQALGPNCKREVFRSSILWKLCSNSSFL